MLVINPAVDCHDFLPGLQNTPASECHQLWLTDTA